MSNIRKKLKNYTDSYSNLNFLIFLRAIYIFLANLLNHNSSVLPGNILYYVYYYSKKNAKN